MMVSPTSAREEARSRGRVVQRSEPSDPDGTGGRGSARACVLPVSIDRHGLIQTRKREGIAMGSLLILLGLGAGGLVADYLGGDEPTRRASPSVNLLGGSFSL